MVTGITLTVVFSMLLCLCSGSGLSVDLHNINIEAHQLRKSSGTAFPVILVPGDGGSQVQASLDKPEVVHYFCYQHSSGVFYDIWLNLELLIPEVIDCFVDNMMLYYNSTTRQSHNSPGVTIRIPGFGNTSTVEFLDKSRVSVSVYFNTIVEAVVKLGLKRGVTVRGAPYDFRKAPNEHKEYFENMTKVVESAYENQNQTKVVLITHSMGGPFALYFLNHKPQAWKDKYIKALVSLAGVWGGTVKTMEVYAAGYNLGSWYLSPLTLRREQRTSPSLAFLMPTDKFWKPDEVLIATPAKNYTLKDYQTFFQDIQWPNGWEMRKDTKDLIYDLTPPGVEVHCIYGRGVASTEKLVYRKKEHFPDTPDFIQQGDGDGTVNYRSLEGCLRWKGKQEQHVYTKVIAKCNHMDILKHPDVIDYITKVVGGH